MLNKLKVAYHMPSLSSIYAQRTIYWGYRHAFEDLGHKFYTYSSNDNLNEFLGKHKIDLFMTASHFFYRKQLDYELLKKYRKKGMILLTKLDFWRSPFHRHRITDAIGMNEDLEARRLISRNLLGDIYYHVVEQDDWRMEGFRKSTGIPYYTIPLAADKSVIKPMVDQRFDAQISFIGTYLPDKKKKFDEYLFPLKSKYNLKLYGQDWTMIDRYAGWMQRACQYFNVPVLKTLRKPKLNLDDEPRIYSNSIISINIHEENQEKYGGDCNERTFKIPLSKGFEITDNVSCISKYYTNEKEIIIAKNKNDWFDKIEHYINYPNKRNKIISEGYKKTLHHHTYHNRVALIGDLYEKYKN